ncbi:MAG: hypothetical protein GY805_13825, partial [Chloroflexi bacterium]|nr:hypothetical protein [Chloroflexota bacterium]
MRIKSYSICYLIGLMFILALIGCSNPPKPSSATTTATPTPKPETLITSTFTPVPSPVPSPEPTPSPTKAISQWLLSGSFVRSGMDTLCAPNLSPDSFILGAQTDNCQPAETDSIAEILVQAPSGEDRQVALLHIICTDTEDNCANAVQITKPGGVISIYVDSQRLWQADCSSLSLEECTSRFFAKIPIVAFASGDTAVHHVQIKTSPNISWQITDIEVEWQPVPNLLRGVAFSPFRDCQNPHWGPFPSSDQVLEDLLLVRHMGNAVRTYSSVGVQGQIPAMAQELGLQITAGAWLGPDIEKNEEEIEALINLVQQDVGIESVIVGNEVLLRGDLTEAELIEYIERVKEAIDVPVTSAETIGHLMGHPELIDALDYVLVHIYAYWDKVAIEDASQHTLQMYNLTQEIANGKTVVIGETGWPSNGPTNGSAVPSIENEQRFWREFLTLVQQEEIELFFFAGFDELWKTEGGVGPYWGMLDSERINKFDLQSVYIPMNYETKSVVVEAEPIATSTRGALEISAQEELFPIFINYAAAENHFAPSGHMGDYRAIKYNDCARLTEAWEETAIEIQYDPTLENVEGWAGIYWQEPENNWGYYPEGYNLENFAQLRFRARSLREDSQVKFFVGGVDTG